MLIIVLSALVFAVPFDANKRYVFVTSQKWEGDLGGLTGADSKCVSAAQAGGLPGAYKAFLGDSTNPVESRLEHSSVPYYIITNGIEKKVANNWDSLFIFNLQTPIQYDEFGNGASSSWVWSGPYAYNSDIDDPTADCNGWTSTARVSSSGRLYKLNKEWYFGGIQPCNQDQFPNPIYCFQSESTQNQNTNQLSCTLRVTGSCNAGELAVLKLSGGTLSSDSHAALPNYQGYNKIICCKSTDDTLTTSCTDDKAAGLIRLSAEYDASSQTVNYGAGQESGLGLYQNMACLSGTNQKIECRSTSEGASCNTDETGIVEISAETNANTAYYGTANFPIKVCCKQTLAEGVEGTIININTGADNYDAVALPGAKWFSCNTDSIKPAGEVFNAGQTKQAGDPIHDYLCYNTYNDEVNIERIGECIGDDAKSYSQNYADNIFWHVSGTNIIANNKNYYCCRDEYWHDDLDINACKEGGVDSVCELNGFKLADGGEPTLASFGGYSTGTETNGCCGNDKGADGNLLEFYVSTKCSETSTVTPKCCNSAADRLDANGNCVAQCNENTDALCSDGQDNDGDSAIDCADSECKGKAGTGGQGICCQETSVVTDCKTIGDLGNCGQYSCTITNNPATTNRCNITENKEGCKTNKPGICASFTNKCIQNGAKFECDYTNDHNLCTNTDGSQACDKYCDTDGSYFFCSTWTSTTSSTEQCSLKHSDCIKHTTDGLSYTLPNEDKAAACVCHERYSDCQTNQNALTSIIGAPNCGAATQGGNAPVITSTPILSAIEDSYYEYDVNSNKDGQTGTVYSLSKQPISMSINSATGIIQWVPDNSHVGSMSVTVKATDSAGLFGEQAFAVSVANNPPTIQQVTLKNAYVGNLYAFDVQTDDEAVGSSYYSLVTKPIGMTIDVSSGVIMWTPTSSQLGNHPVSIMFNDNHGATDTEDFTITVTENI